MMIGRSGTKRNARIAVCLRKTLFSRKTWDWFNLFIPPTRIDKESQSSAKANRKGKQLGRLYRVEVSSLAFSEKLNLVNLGERGLEKSLRT
jgi:hypothetical protein